MPVIRNTEDWEKVFRKQVRSISEGCTVRESPRGKKVILKVRTDREESKTLDFKWQESEQGNTYSRMKNICVDDDNLNFKNALDLTGIDSPKLLEN